jgi:hypothetical protein
MSDGPYRSLPMRHACKRLAKRAQQSAFDPNEVMEAVCPALEAHWAGEVSQALMKRLRDICETRQRSFLDDNQRAAFDAARRETVGGGALGGVLVDCVEQAMADGKSGNEALKSAAHHALLDRAVRDARTVEEHYQREASAHSATRVHARIMEAIGRAPIEDLAGRVISGAASSNRSPPRRDGIDEGVALP